MIEPRADNDQRHLRDGCPVCEARRRGEQLPDDPNDSGKVYITTDREYARVFAAGYGDGALYRVEPMGPLTPTTDDSVPSWSCGAARVLSVYDALVRFTPSQARRAVRRFTA